MRRDKEKKDEGRAAASYCVIPAALAAGVFYAIWKGTETAGQFLIDLVSVAFCVWFLVSLVLFFGWDGIKGKRGTALAVSVLKHSVGWCAAAAIFAALLRQ